MIHFAKAATVVFAGDSITDGNRGLTMDCNHIFGHGYQTVIAGRLGSENLAMCPRFVNNAHSGWTLDQIYARWDEEVLVFRPEIISILIGFNDAQKGFENHLTPEEVNRNYETCFDELLNNTRKALPSSRIILMEPFFLPSSVADPFEYVPHPRYNEAYDIYRRSVEQDEYLTDTVKRLSKTVRIMTERHGCIFVPLSKTLQEAAKFSGEPYLVWDGIHPTIVGHELIARQWISAVEVEMV